MLGDPFPQVIAAAAEGGEQHEAGLLLLSMARPAIAQLAEHLTVDICRYQMVPGSIPGGRIMHYLSKSRRM